MPAIETSAEPRSPGPLEMTLGSKLKNARIYRSLSRADVASQLGVKPKTIENWELNAAEPSLKMLKLLSQLLEVPVVELMDEVEGVEGAPEPVPQDRAAARILQARRKLEEAARLLGGTIVFGARQPAQAEDMESDDTDASSAPPPSALDVLETTAADKGIRSRALVGKLAAARAELRQIDYDDLYSRASTSGIDLVGLADPEEALDQDQRSEATLQVESFLLADAVYGDHWRALTVDTFQRAADEVKSNAYKDDPELRGGFVDRKRWSEDDDQYRVRLRREITPHLLIALERGRPVDLAAIVSERAKSTKSAKE